MSALPGWNRVARQVTQHRFAQVLKRGLGKFRRALFAGGRLLAGGVEHCLGIRHDLADQDVGPVGHGGDLRDGDAEQGFQHRQAPAQLGLGFLHYVPRFVLVAFPVTQSAASPWRAQAGGDA